MNGKQARMLRKMHRNDHASKRLLMSLPHYVRGKIRTWHRNPKEVPADFDFLGHVTNVYPKEKKVEHTDQTTAS